MDAALLYFDQHPAIKMKHVLLIANLYLDNAYCLIPLCHLLLLLLLLLVSTGLVSLASMS